MEGSLDRQLRSPKGRYFWTYGLILILLVLTFACGQQAPGFEQELPLTQFRRSVLDQQVRMLTLRYGEDKYVAYSLADPPYIYKVWRGGVTWNGTNYNNLKEIQPESYGEQYLLRPTPKYVLERQNGNREELVLEHGSYVLEDGGLAFYFGVENAGLESCKIVETPGFHREDGGLVFHRQYAMQGFEAGSKIFVDSFVVKAQQPATLLYPLDSVPPTPHPGEASIASSSHYWLSKSGCNTCHAMDYKMVGPSYHEIANAYEADESTLESLTAKVKNGTTGTWGDAVMTPHPDLPLADIENMVKGILTLAPKDQAKVLPPKRKDLVTTDEEIPGFGSVVTDVHPSFTLETIRPSGFRPRVGSLEFGSGGELYVGTWDSIGAIYQLTGVETSDTNMIEVTKVATGLAEPLGMEAVGSDLYVMQKHELTQLLDHDGDGTIDEYKSINNDFDVTTDFHEFAYDIEFMDGYFYGTLGLAMRLMTIERQLPHRGTAFKMNHSGDFEILANGLRQPNGIGVGVDGELFTTENQGRWVPCCKLIHIRPGDFHGCLSGQGDRFDGMEITPPAVWLPQGEIGNSPGEALLMTEGPYAGQMMFGDVSHGGINRAYLEKINGAYQGCVFRFCQGLEAGVNRIVRGPDDALYIGGVGMTGGWSHNGRQFGLQKLVYNGTIPFEMLGMRATTRGFDVEFTHPISPDTKLEDLALKVSQWYYKPTAAYGGPKLDKHELEVDRMEISEDGTILHLDMNNRKLGYVVYLFFDRSFLSADGKALRSGEAWYTLNAIPEEVL